MTHSAKALRAETTSPIYSDASPTPPACRFSAPSVAEWSRPFASLRREAPFTPLLHTQPFCLTPSLNLLSQPVPFGHPAEHENTRGRGVLRAPETPLVCCGCACSNCIVAAGKRRKLASAIDLLFLHFAGTVMEKVSASVQRKGVYHA